MSVTRVWGVLSPAQRRCWAVGLVSVTAFALLAAEVWLNTQDVSHERHQCTPQPLQQEPNSATYGHQEPNNVVFAAEDVEEGWHDLLGVCLPLSPAQLWADASRMPWPPHAVLAQIKITACELLQRRSHISPWFNCTASMHKYVSAVAVAIFTTYVDVARATLRAPPTSDAYAGGPRGHTTGQSLHESCLRRDGTQNCLQCRAWWLDVNTIDIRLNETEALSMTVPFLRTFDTTEKRAEAIHSAFANTSFFQYHTLTPSRAYAVHSSQALFRAPLCRPQVYCEAIVRGLSWLTQASVIDQHAKSDAKFYFSQPHYAGIGSALHVMMHKFVLAAGMGYKYVQHPGIPFPWTMPSDCPSQLLSCYFDLPTDSLLPWIMEKLKYDGSGVLPQDKLGDLPPERTMFEATGPTSNPLLRYYVNGQRVEKKVSSDPFETWTEEERSEVYNFIVDEGQLAEVGNVISESVFLRKQFFRALSMRYLVDRLKPHMNAIVEHEVSRYGLPHPIASIHVRHGDKNKEMELKSLGHHIGYVGPILYAFGIRNIFLSTEDPNVTRQAISEFGNFHWIFTDDERMNPSLEGFLEGNRTHEFCLGLRNLFLAVECDVFVGTRASNWNRLIDELQRSKGLGGSYYIDINGHREDSIGYAEW